MILRPALLKAGDLKRLMLHLNDSEIKDRDVQVGRSKMPYFALYRKKFHTVVSKPLKYPYEVSPGKVLLPYSAPS